MKKILFFILLVVTYSDSVAQSRITTVEYQKMSRDAIANEIPFTQDIILEAILDTMQKMGYKGKDSKGFTVYIGVKLAAFGNDAYDLYFSAEKKSRKEKDVSMVTMMVSKGNGNFVTEITDPTLIQNAKIYLNNLQTIIALYDLQKKISEQEAVVSNATKKAAGLNDDANDLQKKKKKIEKEIEDNIKDRANQQAELEKQKQMLEALKANKKQ